MVGGHKLAGVLAESSSDGVESALIVGVGVNVHSSARDLADLASPATSVWLASNVHLDRGVLLRELLKNVDRWLQRPEAELRGAWQARLWGRGQRVRLADVDVDEEVVILGADFDGALRVRRADGRELSTTTGELIL